jgi:hypothetical protein
VRGGSDTRELTVDSLGRKRGSPRTSPTIGLGGRATEAARSGGVDDLNSDESELFHKRNPMEGGEQMWWWIVKLPSSFIGRRWEVSWCRGGETAGGEWNSSMLPFQGEDGKGQDPFQKSKGARGATLCSRTNMRPEDVASQRHAMAASSRSRAAFGLARHGREPVGLVGPNTILEIKQAVKME